MVDFYLFTNEQSLVDQLENFELRFDLIESPDDLAALAQDTILLLDITNDSIDLKEVQSLCPESTKIVIVVDNVPRREIRRLIEAYPNVFSFISFPLQKGDVEDVIQELKTFIDTHKKSKHSEGVKSSKFDLEFSVLEEETSDATGDQAPEMDSAEKKAFSRKLGMFNFFEEKEYEQDSDLNQRVQYKFNHVYGSPDSRTRSNLFVSKLANKDGASLELPTEEIEDLENIKEVFTSQDEDMATKNKKGLEFNLPKLEFEDAPVAAKEEAQPKANLDFDLEFGNEDEAAESDFAIESKLSEAKNANNENQDIGIDFSNDLDLEIEKAQSNPDATSKTIVFDRSSLNNIKTPNAPAAGGLNFDSLEDEENEDLFGLQQSHSADAPAEEIPESGLDLSGLDSSQVGFSIEPRGAASESPASATLDQDSVGLSLSDTDDSFELELGTSAQKKATAAKAPESTGSLDSETKDLAESLEFKNDGNSLGSNSTADYMSTAEARANIESTINDIVRPQLGDKTEEIDLGLNLSGDEATVLADSDLFKNDADDFSREFTYKQKDHSLSFTAKKDAEKNIQDISFGNGLKIETGENTDASLPGFDLSVPDNDTAHLLAEALQQKSNDALVFKNLDRDDEKVGENKSYRQHADAEHLVQEHRKNERPEYTTSNYMDEDFVRAQATIRQLREERDELLLEIKQLKRETKELEQENLSLRAENDELRIEQSIARKRHLAELEDVKYHLQLADEKRLTAEEKLRQSEKNREKLEQKLRLDFSQVRQREKELENQLELLSIDHDTQIQTRDSKILELRRKIESLEFNMENASIREQRTNEDKKKLEDKLTKIMKTLRHSIENIDEERFGINNDGENE